MDNSMEDQMKVVQEIEQEMWQELHQRLTKVCLKKCIPPKYKETELNKGEGVCIDRCAAKYLEMHDLIGKRLNAVQEEALKKHKS